MSEPPSPAERLAARVPPGTVLGDRYRLESILGAGAFGVVWRSRHVHLETECAVKLFDPPPGADFKDMGTRFLQEARVMARLQSPYVPRVFDYGVHERMPFLVLELLRGTSLRGRLDALRAQGLRLSAAETARVLWQVAEALHVAHAEKVVHRDLKPDNIFLVQEGDSYTAKVLDFGIAKWSADTSPSMTTTGIVMGTPHYMSPEQFESARQVDHRSDLWSLGVIAFECLTGQLPFPGETFIDVAFKVCKEGPPVASQLVAVPPGFDAWFARAAAVTREHRFNSAREQVRALEEVFSAPPAPAAQPSPSLALPSPGSTAATSAGSARTIPLPTVLRAQATAGLGAQWRRLRNPALLIGALSTAVLVWRLRAPEAARPELAPETLPKPGVAETAAPVPDTSQALAAMVPEAVIKSIKSAPTAVPTAAAPLVALVTDTPSASAPSKLTEASKVSKPPPQKPAPKPRAALAPRLPTTVPSAPKPAATVNEPRVEAKAEPTPAEPPASSSAVNEAAAIALSSAASLAASCRPRGGPTGSGKARVIYSNDGSVAAVEILTAKFRDTPTGSCLRMVFRRASMPPFKGDPPTFIKSFVISED